MLNFKMCTVKRMDIQLFRNECYSKYHLYIKNEFFYKTQKDTKHEHLHIWKDIKSFV